MVEKNINQEFRQKNIDETRNYLIEEINRNELMSKMHKKLCTTFSAFASLVGIPVGITSSAIGLKISSITARIIKFTPIIKKEM